METASEVEDWVELYRNGTRDIAVRMRAALMRSSIPALVDDPRTSRRWFDARFGAENHRVYVARPHFGDACEIAFREMHVAPGHVIGFVAEEPLDPDSAEAAQIAQSLRPGIHLGAVRAGYRYWRLVRGHPERARGRWTVVGSVSLTLMLYAFWFALLWRFVIRY